MIYWFILILPSVLFIGMLIMFIVMVPFKDVAYKICMWFTVAATIVITAMTISKFTSNSTEKVKVTKQIKSEFYQK